MQRASNSTRAHEPGRVAGTINGMRFQAPRGTHDLLPDNAHSWRTIEDAFRGLARRYGYREIRTPMFEETELFVRSSGETSEVVSKEMYSFLDKGGRDVSLKPENTAPVIRAYLENRLGDPGQTTRLYYIAPIFRYGRPQKGRFRQHHQMGLELIGSSSPEADAEIIEMTVRFYETVGMSDVRVLLNSIGRAEARDRYREVILKHFASVIDAMTDEQREKARQNPLRLLDSKDPAMQEASACLPPIIDYLEPESLQRFERLQEVLTEASIDFEVAPGIVRGLDYYTDMVFEVQSDRLGAQSSLCGGGRYDHLIQQLGGPDTPAVGVGMGIERALMVLAGGDPTAEFEFQSTYLVAATESARDTVRSLARQLRQKGQSVLLDLDRRSLKAQLKEADRAHVRHAVLIGDDELATGVGTIRDMKTGDQRQVPLNDLIGHL